MVRDEVPGSGHTAVQPERHMMQRMKRVLETEQGLWVADAVADPGLRARSHLSCQSSAGCGWSVTWCCGTHTQFRADSVHSVAAVVRPFSHQLFAVTHNVTPSRHSNCHPSNWYLIVRRAPLAKMLPSQPGQQPALTWQLSCPALPTKQLMWTRC
jgi:hypothetical protein